MHVFSNITLEWEQSYNTHLVQMSGLVFSMQVCTQLKEGVWLVQWLSLEIWTTIVFCQSSIVVPKSLVELFDALCISYVTWIKHFINQVILSFCYIVCCWKENIYMHIPGPQPKFGQVFRYEQWNEESTRTLRVDVLCQSLKWCTKSLCHIGALCERCLHFSLYFV